MESVSQRVAGTDRLVCQPVEPARAVPSLLDDVRNGLLEEPRRLPAKYFYDDHGSQLFDRICDTREYYPTRTEDALLQQCADDIIGWMQPEHVVELGSGASRKTRRLFDACEAQRCHAMYWPFDVCEEMVRDASEALIDEYDWLTINGLVGDYNAGFQHFPDLDGSSLYVFLGGTIGNFQHDEAVRFLEELRDSMSDADKLLLGADRVKDQAVLNAAYNDSDGITAAFNMNLLNVLNREVEADFDIDKFRHYAFFNESESQIEMHLVATEQQTVRLLALDETIEFREGDTIMTEISRKFTPGSLQDLLAEAGFVADRHFQPANEYFSLILASPAGN